MALVSQLSEQIDEMCALDRIGPVERLIQEQNIGVPDQCRGDLGPLAHSLGIALEFAVADIDEIDLGQRGVDRFRPILHPGEAGVELDELTGGEIGVDRLVLWHHRYPAEDAMVRSRIDAKYLHRSL